MEKTRVEAKTTLIRPRTTIVKSERSHGVDESNVATGTEGEVGALDGGHEEKKDGISHEVVPATLGIDTNANPTTEDENGGNQYLTGKRLALVYTGIMMAVLLVGLDQSIVSTALPKLSSQFDALDRLTWIVSAYFLTQAALILFFGQVLTIISSKWIFLFCIAVFEIGSLICAVAPNIDVLIFGRAIQGVGGSGGYVAILAIISQVARLEVRPLLFALLGAVFGLASIFGPLLGGVFTDKLTWRWCFYINLPFGAVSLLAVFILLPNQPPLQRTRDSENSSNVPKNESTFQKWKSLDWVGTVLSLGMTVSLLLPLTWGGTERAWNDRVVIALFVVSGVLFILFLLWEHRLGERAMMPLSMFMRRTQLSAGIATFAIKTTSIMLNYYLPFFYQAKGLTAVRSGINIIPMTMAMPVGGFLSAWLTKVTGRYTPYLVVGPALFVIAAGLFFTVDLNTSNAKLIGYQILIGIGEGLVFQIPLIAIQAEYADEPDLIPQASSLMTYLQLLGAACGISIAGAIFGNRLGKDLAQYSDQIPLDVIKAVKESVTYIFTDYPNHPGYSVQLRDIVVAAYIKAINYTFLMVIVAGGVTIISGLFIKNWNLKQRGKIPANNTTVKPAAAEDSA